MSSPETAILVEGVSKDFILPHEKVSSVKKAFINPFQKRGTSETQRALKDISFEIKKGEFFGIVGRNGSGKSTLLKILAEIYQPTTGSVKVDGKLVPFIELGVGFNPELTGRENVYLNGSLLGFSKGEVDDLYDEIVEFAELEKFMDQKLKNYSSGMQVRLAFSVATHASADILLIDEVLAVGDADFQRKCFDYFRKLKKQKRTVVFVSHDMNAIREYCDRAVLIEKSQIVTRGTSDEVATEYAKMFIKEARREVKKDSAKPEADRWGTGKLELSKVALGTSSGVITPQDDTLKITVTLKANENVADINLGFQVKNAAGALILGTNSKIIKQNIEKMKKGESRKYEWLVPNIFSEGTHYVSVAVEANNDVADWIEQVCDFDVLLEQKTPFIVSPKITLSQKDSSN